MTGERMPLLLTYKDQRKRRTFPGSEFLKGRRETIAVFGSFQKLGVIEWVTVQ
jgi:hypothetical protein